VGTGGDKTLVFGMLGVDCQLACLTVGMVTLLHICAATPPHAIGLARRWLDRECLTCSAPSQCRRPAGPHKPAARSGCQCRAQLGGTGHIAACMTLGKGVLRPSRMHCHGSSCIIYVQISACLLMKVCCPRKLLAYPLGEMWCIVMLS
jgi:hypothetical protein